MGEGPRSMSVTLRVGDGGSFVESCVEFASEREFHAWAARSAFTAEKIEALLGCLVPIEQMRDDEASRMAAGFSRDELALAAAAVALLEEARDG